jgi:hypothetical protein
MYVRNWKDTEMVTTSDSGTSESASNEGQEHPPAGRPLAPNPRATGPTASAAAASTPSPRASAPVDQAPDTAGSAGPSELTEPAPKRAVPGRGSVSVSRSQVAAAVSGVRERVAAIVWILTVVAAVILAAGALLIALDANPNNDLVDRVVTWAGDLDGPFNNMFTFDGDNAATKEALVNWGLAAVAWLVGGKIVSSIIRP